MKITSEIFFAVASSIGMLPQIGCGQKMPSINPGGVMTIEGLPTGEQTMQIDLVKREPLPGRREKITLQYAAIDANVRKTAIVEFLFDDGINPVEELPLTLSGAEDCFAFFNYTESQIGWFEAYLGVVATSGVARIEHFSRQSDWLELEFSIRVTSVAVTSGWDDAFTVYADGLYAGLTP